MNLITGAVTSVGAGRISYMYGLRGACLTVETACSSSLVATHLTHQALASGDWDGAIAGGVNLTINPRLSAAFTVTGKVKLLSTALDWGADLLFACRRVHEQEQMAAGLSSAVCLF